MSPSPPRVVVAGAGVAAIVAAHGAQLVREELRCIHRVDRRAAARR